MSANFKGKTKGAESMAKGNNVKSTQLCYECYDDQLYAKVGFDATEQAVDYLAGLVERKTVVECPNCKRKIDYGRERI